MLPFLKNPKFRFFFACGVVLAFLILRFSLGGIGMLGKQPGQPEAEVAKHDPKIKVAAETDLVQKIIYLKCNDEEVFRTKPADNLVGLNISQVQQVYNGWTIDKFDPREVEMTLKVDSYCREHANNLFVGVKDGRVAVFHGRPGPKAIVREITAIEVNRLSPGDQEELRRGLVVKSREDLLRTLEGMQSQ